MREPLFSLANPFHTTSFCLVLLYVASSLIYGEGTGDNNKSCEYFIQLPPNQ